MPGGHARSTNPHLGGIAAIVLFAITLLSFVIESQLTQYVQMTLGYRHPFFLFYLVHSSFFISFPLHLLYLIVTTRRSPRVFLAGLVTSLQSQLSPSGFTESTHLDTPFPILRFLLLVALLTVGITGPALLWFAAVSLASISDVTALWNTNAFFAYIFTVKIFGLKWEARRIGAVLAATLGAAAVVYGGSTSSPDQPSTLSATMSDADIVVEVEGFRPSAPLVGDLLTVVASVGYGLYQVLYKKYAALPNDPELVESTRDGYAELSASGSYESIFDDEGDETQAALPEHADSEKLTIYPPPFGLHPNFLTSAIGLCTFLILWIPLPILHYSGIEPFALPPNVYTMSVIACIALSGVFFNAGLMVLLGIWGPVVVSVGNLLTIVLVFISDALFGRPADITLWSLVGAGFIVAAFGVLAMDMLKPS
ncbi:hypothetical protein JAAARDRAFT_695624 [Jaapia argillacea MUCL 33604]|uniref:EamA domain-containing protein n=1 Tax=Jaapia argillacea MUCL 33604 TaxID=933084 RepID=A0A067Q941_9AGAM|nr:hypothetical protein JAAARDRAFT_695624 [Jaapia argillacea MUCL 33604]